jgi:hypothetical protein
MVEASIRACLAIMVPASRIQSLFEILFFHEKHESRIKKKTAADEESTPFALRSPDKAQSSEKSLYSRWLHFVVFVLFMDNKSEMHSMMVTLIFSGCR